MSFQADDEIKSALLPEGYSSHVHCEDPRREQADEGCRILEKGWDELESQKRILQTSFDI